MPTHKQFRKRALQNKKKRANGGSSDDDDSSSSSKPKYSLRTRVKKFWEGRGWLVGFVVSLEDDTYVVLYENESRQVLNEAQMEPLVLMAKLERKSRIAVSHDNKYYHATVRRMHPTQKPTLVEYDNGEREWVDLQYRGFRLLPRNSKRGDGPEKPAAKQQVTTSRDLAAANKESPRKEPVPPCGPKEAPQPQHHKADVQPSAKTKQVGIIVETKSHVQQTEPEIVVTRPNMEKKDVVRRVVPPDLQAILESSLLKSRNHPSKLPMAHRVQAARKNPAIDHHDWGDSKNAEFSSASQNNKGLLLSTTLGSSSLLPQNGKASQANGNAKNGKVSDPTALQDEGFESAGSTPSLDDETKPATIIMDSREVISSRSDHSNSQVSKSESLGRVHDKSARVGTIQLGDIKGESNSVLPESASSCPQHDKRGAATIIATASGSVVAGNKPRRTKVREGLTAWKRRRSEYSDAKVSESSKSSGPYGEQPASKRRHSENSEAKASESSKSSGPYGEQPAECTGTQQRQRVETKTIEMKATSVHVELQEMGSTIDSGNPKASVSEQISCRSQSRGFASDASRSRRDEENTADSAETETPEALALSRKLGDSNAKVSAESAAVASQQASSMQQDAEMEDGDSLLAQVKPGTRISIRSRYDPIYFPSSVLMVRNEQQGFYVEYDWNNYKEWLDLGERQFCLEGEEPDDCIVAGPRTKGGRGPRKKQAKPKKAKSEMAATQESGNSAEAKPKKPKSSDLSKVKVGSRLSILLSEDDEYHSCTVVEIHEGRNEPYYLEYDDGRSEWTHLGKRTFHLRRGRRPLWAKQIEQRSAHKTETEIQAEPMQESGIANEEQEAVPEETATQEDEMQESEITTEEEETAGEEMVGQEERMQESEIANKEEKTAPEETAGQEDKMQESEIAGHDATMQESEIANEEQETAPEETAGKEDRPKSSDVAKVKVGSRLSVYWPDSLDWYDCTVTTIREDRKRPYHLEYDDGHSEWLGLQNHTFRLKRGRRPQWAKELEEKEHKTVGNSVESEQKKKDKKSANREEREKNPDLVKVVPGSRLSVYWPEDEKWYDCTVTKIRKDRKKPFYLDYDDGQSEWLELGKHKFRILPSEEKERDRPLQKNEDGKAQSKKEAKQESMSSHPEVETENKAQPKSSDLSKVKVGSRMSVYWPDDDQWYDCTVIDIREERKRPYHLEYDDGESEWIHLGKHAFHLKRGRRPLRANQIQKRARQQAVSDGESDMEGEAELAEELQRENQAESKSSDLSKVKVGSRMSVYWPDDDEWYDCSVIEIREDRKRPYHLDYDDGYSEWIQLQKHKFRLKRGRRPLRKKGVKEKKKQEADSDDSDTDEHEWESESTSEEELEENPDMALITVDSRVAVWWSGDSRYYEGSVTKERNGKKSFYLEYDDGDKEWIDFSKHKFRLLAGGKRRLGTNNGEIVHSHQKEESDSDIPDIDRITVGSRVAVYWAGDRKYYRGTVTRRRQSRKPFYLEYDDGEREWIDFGSHKFRLLAAKPCDTSQQPSLTDEDAVDEMETEEEVSAAEDKDGADDDDEEEEEEQEEEEGEREEGQDEGNGESVQEDLGDSDVARVDVGSRVAVWWPDDRAFYNGTVTRKRNHGKPFYLEYDDGDVEWIDLTKHRFRIHGGTGSEVDRVSERVYSEDEVDTEYESFGINRKTSPRKRHKPNRFSDEL